MMVRNFVSFTRIPKGLFLLVVFLSVFWILSFAYIENQAEFSPTMILHKEIADDCFPSALCDKKGNIHIKPLRLVTHFYAMNLALLIGFFRSLKTIKSGVWDRTPRNQ